MEKSGKYVLGVDAGNTKTVAVIAEMNGRIVGSGRGGCGDIYNASSALAAIANVNEAVQAALRSAVCLEADIQATACSMAGADWPEDFVFIEAALAEKLYATNLVVVNDAVGALKAGAAKGWGVAIANGTGAAISAGSADGKLWHSSWWQEGGGARTLGQAALRAVFQAELGLQPPTALTDRVLAHYGMPTVERLLHRFTCREGRDTSGAPSLARLLLDVAAEGDEAARSIVTQEAIILGDYALLAARKVDILHMPFELVLTGSVFKHSSNLLVDAIIERVRAQADGVNVVRKHIEPVAGAVLVALQKAGVVVNKKIRERVRETIPASELFAT